MRANIFAYVVLALCAVGALWAWNELRRSAIPAPIERPVRLPTETHVTEVHGIGYVEPAGEVRRLTFKRGGLIRDCNVKVGQHVELGDLLMTLDHELVNRELEIAEAELEFAKAEQALVLRGVNDHRIVAAEKMASYWMKKLDYWNIESERRSSLLDKNAVSETEVALARMERDSAAERVAAGTAEVSNLKNYVLPEDKAVAASKVNLAESKISLLQQRIQEAELKAPFAGTILELLRREGEGVTHDSLEPVVLFADTSALRVRAEVDERFVQKIKPGQKVRLLGKNLNGKDYVGTVYLVKQVMGAKTVFSRTSMERKDLDAVQVLIDVGSDFRAPSGLRVDVIISLADLPIDSSG